MDEQFIADIETANRGVALEIQSRALDLTRKQQISRAALYDLLTIVADYWAKRPEEIDPSMVQALRNSHRALQEIV